MARASLLYVGTLAFLAAGLPVIMLAGKRLRAPYALAGTWWPEHHDDHAAPRAHPFTVSQSGCFVRILPETWQHPIHLRWQGESLHEDGTRIIRLAGEGQTLTVHAPAISLYPAAVHRFEFSGKIQAVWKAVRESETGQSNITHAVPPR